jgi:WD40 repeat protein
MKQTLLAIALIATSPLAASASDPTYWSDVRPILRKNCTVCHSERKLAELEVSAGLALDKPELIRSGSRSGKVLVAGKPEASLLFTLLTSKDKKRAMPLDAEPLTAADIATIRKWILAGAPEGTKPVQDETALPVAVATRPVRKLAVGFPVKAVLPRSANLPGPLELSLPIGPLPPVAAVAFSPDGKLLAAGVHGRVTVWDLARARPVKVLTNVLGAVNDLKFSPDGKLLAVAGGQPSIRGDLRIFDTAEWKLIHSLGGHLDTVSSVAFGPDSTRLVSASFDKTVRLWDAKSGKLLHTFTGHSDFVYSVAFGPGGAWYATASKDRTGRIVEAASGKGLATLSGMDQEVLAVAVRPDGQVLTSGLEPAVSWWDSKTAERLRKTAGPGVAVHELALDAKGSLYAAAGGDGTVRFFKGQTGDLLRTAQAGSVVFAVALDPEGKRAASGGGEGVVKVWDTADARLLATLWSGPEDTWLAIVPEGFFAASDKLLGKGIWTAGGKAIADTNLLAPLADPAQVGKSLLGQKVHEPVLK